MDDREGVFIGVSNITGERDKTPNSAHPYTERAIRYSNVLSRGRI